MNNSMKAKSFFLSVIIALTFILDFKKMLLDAFENNHIAILTVAFVALAQQLIILYWKLRYNTSVDGTGWTKAIIAFNICTGLILAVGIVKAWAIDSSIDLNGSLVDFMSKLVVFSNAILTGLSVNWTEFKDKVLIQLNEPIEKK